MYCKKNFVAYHHKYSGHKQGILLAVDLRYQTSCDTKSIGIMEIPSKIILLNVYEINERYNFEVPAIQIPVLMLFNKQELQERNIFSGVSSCGIFMGRRRFSVSSATGESRKKAPMRIQSVCPYKLCNTEWTWAFISNIMIYLFQVFCFPKLKMMRYFQTELFKCMLSARNYEKPIHAIYNRWKYRHLSFESYRGIIPRITFQFLLICVFNKMYGQSTIWPHLAMKLFLLSFLKYSFYVLTLCSPKFCLLISHNLRASAVRKNKREDKIIKTTAAIVDILAC